MNPVELKVARTRANKTQEDMAKILGLSVVAYSKKERGETRFSIEQVAVVAVVLMLDLDAVNVIFFDGKLPKRKDGTAELRVGNDADGRAPT